MPIEDHPLSRLLANLRDYLPRRVAVSLKKREIRISDAETGEQWGVLYPFEILDLPYPSFPVKIQSLVLGLLSDVQDAAIEITREAWPQREEVSGSIRLPLPAIRRVDHDQIEVGYAFDDQWAVWLGRISLSSSSWS